MPTELIVKIISVAASDSSWVDYATGFAAIGAIIGLIISIIFNTLTLKKNNQIQKDALMHDMVKFEMENWKYIQSEKGKRKLSKGMKEHIFNYYEYLAYLILRKKLNVNEAKTLWKPNIYGIYDKFKTEFSRDRKELRALYEKWKSEE
jgi:uncharacterized membrane protein YgaE (UPF0421/DUF939 family)